MSDTPATDWLHEEICEDDWPAMYNQMRELAERLERSLHAEQALTEMLQKKYASIMKENQS